MDNKIGGNVIFDKIFVRAGRLWAALLHRPLLPFQPFGTHFKFDDKKDCKNILF
jgi:hypothetical protein